MDDLQQVNPALLLLGLALQLCALVSYSDADQGRAAPGQRLGRADGPHPALHPRAGQRRPRRQRGRAPPSATGCSPCRGSTGPTPASRWPPPASASAVVLNIIFWTGLLVSIPLRGVNPFYGTAAIIGVVLVVLMLLLVIGLLKGQARAERILRSLARRFRFDEDHAASVVRQIAGAPAGAGLGPQAAQLGHRLGHRQLAARRRVPLGLPARLRRQRAPRRADRGVRPGQHLRQLPHHPRWASGIVEGIYIPTLVGFGLSRSVATLGVISYRVAQYWLPILLGGLAYLSLRVGPWSIERRDRLERFRVLAKDETEIFESGLEWAERYGHRPTDPTVPLERRR